MEEKYKLALEQLALYFTSGNKIPVSQATISAEDFWKILEPTGIKV
jgi:hypothetical protein